MSPASSVMGAAALATPTHRGLAGAGNDGSAAYDEGVATAPSPAATMTVTVARPRVRIAPMRAFIPHRLPLDPHLSAHAPPRVRIVSETAPARPPFGDRAGAAELWPGQAVSAGAAGASTSSPIEDTRCFEM